MFLGFESSTYDGPAIGYNASMNKLVELQMQKRKINDSVFIK